MLKYPMPFQVMADASSGIAATWNTRAESTSQTLPVAIPPEFSGPGGGLSPEDLYAMALQNCFVATFKVFAEKSKLIYRSLAANGCLEVDRNEDGRPWMARFHLIIVLRGVSQVENARRILEKASESCMILNSVNTAKTFEFRIEE